MLSSPFLFLPFYLFIINAFRQQPSNFFCWSIVNFAAVLWRLHISIVVGRANVAFFLPTMPEFASSTWMHRAINKKKQANEKKETFNDFNLPRVSKNGGISNKLQRKVAESRTQRKCAAANSNDWWMLEFMVLHTLSRWFWAILFRTGQTMTMAQTQHTLKKLHTVSIRSVLVVAFNSLVSFPSVFRLSAATM